MTAELKVAEKVAAFFDLDGTLIPEPSLERRLFAQLRYGHRIPLANYLRWVAETVRLLPNGLLAAQYGNKRYLTGVPRDLVFRHMGPIVFFQEGIARVAWHARQGHEIVIVSGTLDLLAELAAIALGCELEVRGISIRPHVSATCLQQNRGRWTGHIKGEALYGAAKARSVEAIARQERIDLRQSHAYGNSLLDRHMLFAVGHGHAVNPGKDLAAVANEKHWPVWHWHLEKQLACKQKSYLPKEIHHIEGPA